MTSKQKANRERFKKVVAEAKKLRAKNPKLTQAQAVKQAWAITYSKKTVSGVKKKAVKKSSPTKVKAKKSKRTSEMHTDTKSHNVNIRVVSGIKLSYKIFTGYDWKNGKNIYHVVGINNDYHGEWHKTKKEAQRELNSLKKKTISGIYKGYIK